MDKGTSLYTIRLITRGKGSEINTLIHKVPCKATYQKRNK